MTANDHADIVRNVLREDARQPGLDRALEAVDALVASSELWESACVAVEQRFNENDLVIALRKIVDRLPPDDDPYDGSANTIIGPIARAALRLPP